MAGFWLIEAAHEAEAVEWTIRVATALQGRIEVRAAGTNRGPSNTFGRPRAVAPLYVGV